MSGHLDDYPRWYLIEPGVIAKVEDNSVSGLVIYGAVSAERLRSIRLTRLDHLPRPRGAKWAKLADGSIPVPAAFPEWSGETPPTPEEARLAEQHLAGTKVGRLVPTGRRRSPNSLRQQIVEASTRRPGEAASDFYERFARMVEEISPIVPSPNKAIADATGLSANTVKQYVHRARTLGFLSPSRRRRT